MKRSIFFALAVTWLVIALLLPNSGVRAQTPITTATPTPTPTATPSPTPTVAPRPSAATLMQKSATALKSVQWVHANARLQSSSSTGGLDLHITGDCGDVKATFSKNQLQVTRVRGKVRLRGTSTVNGKTTHVNGDLIAIVSGNSGTMWVRSGGPGARWKSTKTTGIRAIVDGLLAYVCIPLLYSHATPAAIKSGVKGARVASSTLGGTPVWKVTTTQRSGSTVQTTATFLDQASLYWLRYSGHQQATTQNNPSQIVINFSRYGQVVAIKPPKG